MKLHKVKCDNCKIEEHLKYNGEHFLAPQGWYELYDDYDASVTGIHVCPKCVPKFMPKKEIKKGQSK